MATFDLQVLRDELAKKAPRLIIDEAFEIAETDFEIKKSKMLDDFNKDEVTREIEEGNEAPNYSKTLGSKKGNLFTFIGFQEEENPVQPLRELLEDQTYIKKSSTGARYANDKVTYKFPLFVPSEAQIENVTPMPKWSGGSWAKKIERGISGLNYYLFGKFSGSRSGGGIQKKEEIYPIEYKPTKYLSKILDNFKKNLGIK